MNNTHTPTPWMKTPWVVQRIRGWSYAVDRTGGIKTKGMSHDEAAHIVKCVNAHDELVAALSDAADALERVANRIEGFKIAAPGIGDTMQGAADYNRERAAAARAALAKVQPA